jgi:hypothetical protein
VRIHETGMVSRPETENTSSNLDVFIQAGDVLTGGRQDRTIGVDFINPARSGRILFPPQHLGAVQPWFYSEANWSWRPSLRGRGDTHQAS